MHGKGTLFDFNIKTSLSAPGSLFLSSTVGVLWVSCHLSKAACYGQTFAEQEYSKWMLVMFVTCVLVFIILVFSLVSVKTNKTNNWNLIAWIFCFVYLKHEQLFTYIFGSIYWWVIVKDYSDWESSIKWTFLSHLCQVGSHISSLNILTNYTKWWRQGQVSCRGRGH